VISRPRHKKKASKEEERLKKCDEAISHADWEKFGPVGVWKWERNFWEAGGGLSRKKKLLKLETKMRKRGPGLEKKRLEATMGTLIKRRQGGTRGGGLGEDQIINTFWGIWKHVASQPR